MADTMIAVPYVCFSILMRSGRILDIDERFTDVLGYTEDDIKDGTISFKNLVPDVEYESLIKEFREGFIEKRYMCYQHELVAKDNSVKKVVSFYRLENKLLDGHRVLRVSCAMPESLSE
jgi:PAS domain-containing protein